MLYPWCRLPASTTAAQRLEVVASAIAVLGLADVRHALIGDEEVRARRCCRSLSCHWCLAIVACVFDPISWPVCHSQVQSWHVG
jgi:hypothetical protein